MSKKTGALFPAKTDREDMFIGWDKAPSVDRRFLLGALPLGLAGAAGVSYIAAKKLNDPGAGAWLTGDLFDVTGVLTTAPYPMIRVADLSRPFGMRTVLVVAQGKCTSSLSLANVEGTLVTASGALIERKDRRMLEVPPLQQQWLKAAPADPAVDMAALANPAEQDLGLLTLRGSIMDSKCFFGVMRPGRGKTHKACAALCIRGGIPPSFWVRDGAGRESVLLMTDASGGPVPMDILPLVADPVEAQGRLVRVGDIVQFRADVSAFKRL